MNNSTDFKIGTNFTNVTNNFRQDIPILGWTIAVLLTNSCGALANILLLLTLILHKPLRQSSSSSLIVHTVCLDLYISSFAVPVTVIPIFLGPLYELPQWFCQYQFLYVQMVYQIEMYAATMLALHRVAAAVSPRFFIHMTSTAAMILMNALPWVIAMVNCLLPAVGNMGYQMVFNQLNGGCMYSVNGTAGAALALANTSVGIYFPTAVMGAAYGVFLLETWRHSGLQMSRARRRRLELSRTMLILFVWHCVSLYPSSIMVGLFPNVFASNLGLQLAFKYLGNSCSAINPVFCWCSSKLFQDGTRAVLRKLRRCVSGGCQSGGQVKPSSTAREHSAGEPTRSLGQPNGNGMEADGIKILTLRRLVLRWTDFRIILSPLLSTARRPT
ncbi:hypothetical protein BV898_03056 [Hypsibius exemplaris]|uniref:G-protein coupled receptors family 1 profile domain-containing protein n=1 Tax=Hypsibius exemplaris TaxID=2072580 RepID=A0A1W0X620_HYPEX|nr:hypothetical protein BV898_03056 [Hypsibius exemplaris]